jgi:hypothetical protein
MILAASPSKLWREDLGNSLLTFDTIYKMLLTPGDRTKIIEFIQTFTLPYFHQIVIMLIV